MTSARRSPLSVTRSRDGTDRSSAIHEISLRNTSSCAAVVGPLVSLGNTEDGAQMGRNLRCAVAIAFTLAITGSTVTATAASEHPGTVLVVVELDSTPAVDAFEAALARGLGRPEAQQAALRARVQAKADGDGIVESLLATGIQVDEFGRTYNAASTVMLRIPLGALSTLTSLPYIRSVWTVGEPAEPHGWNPTPPN